MGVSVCIVAMAICVSMLLVWDRRPRHALVAKTCASACFVALGMLCSGSDEGFDRLIVLGLVLAAMGDVALALPGERAFQLGILAFALGHLAYLLAAALHISPAWPSLFAFAPLLSSALAYGYLYPRLGPMRAPVAVYVLVITCMLCAAIVLHGQRGAQALRFCVGALLFYVSDLSVARDRFVRLSFVNRLWGLPAYYAGQAYIALSAADL